MYRSPQWSGKAGYQINDLEHKKEKIQSEKQDEKIILKNNKDRVSNFWDNFKCANIRIIGELEGEEKEYEIENLFEKIMKKTFPNMTKKIDLQVQEAQRIPNKLDPKRNTPRHITIKMPNVKDKERILKASR